MKLKGALLSILLLLTLITCRNPLSVISNIKRQDIINSGNTGDKSGSVSLVIKSGNTAKSKTIIPGLEMVIASFDITGTGPDSATFSINTSDSVYTRTDLAVGSWTIEVSAKNQGGQVIASGSAGVTVQSGATAGVTVTVIPLTGPGTLNITVSWPSGSLTNPVLNATLGASGSTANSITLTIAGNSAGYAGTNLEAGYYMLIIDVLEGTVSRYSIVESVRILSGQTTDAVFDLTQAQLSKPAAAPPEFSPAEGTYSSSQTVTITSATQGASIRYTTNGSPPSGTVGRVYSGSIDINSTTTLKAIAYKDGYNTSAVTSGHYEITGTFAVPTVSPAEGLYYDAVNVTLSCETANSVILYTTDGSDPVPGSNGIIYSSPIPVSLDTEVTIKALSYSSTDITNKSDITTAVYRVTGYAADPVISPAGGTYNSDQSVAISCTTPGAVIYYTTDGSTPSSVNGTEYTAAITVDSSMILKAIAVKTDWGDSQVISETYDMVVSDPAFSVAEGTYNQNQSPELTTTTSGATIYYTTDGSEPTAGSTEYTGAITIDVSMTVKAIAVRDGWTSSQVITKTYTLKVSDPVLDNGPGSYIDTVIPVNMSVSTPGASIVYTVDGSTPGSGNGSYGSSVTITTSLTLYAAAVKNGWEDSGVAGGLYNPNDSTVSPSDGGTADTAPLLDWYNIAGSANYHVQISSDSGFATVVEEDDTLTDSQYQVQTSLTGDTYYWRVKRKDGEGTWGDWSSVWSLNVHAIGDTFAGGIIFYFDGKGHGLVAAESDQSTGVGWGGYGTYIGGTSTAVGTGSANTAAIVSKLGSGGTYAAKICADLVLSGYDDWFLPSKDELNLMYQNLKTAGLGGFEGTYYWSSSEYNSYNAWIQYFNGGNQGGNNKLSYGRVRAVRAF